MRIFNFSPTQHLNWCKFHSQFPFKNISSYVTYNSAKISVKRLGSAEINRNNKAVINNAVVYY